MQSQDLIRRATMCGKLRSCAIFEGLPDVDILRVADYAEERAFGKGEFVFRVGEPVEGFFLVIRGIIGAFRSGMDGEERMIHLIQPGESFAEAAVAGPKGYMATARALEDSEVVLIHAKPFLAHLTEQPDLTIRMLASLSRRMHGLVAVIEGYQMRDAESRLLRWLLDRCATTSGPATVVVPTTRTLLAHELGTRRETLSRILAKLRDDGEVVVDGRAINVTDVATLRRRLEQRLTSHVPTAEEGVE